VIAELTAKPLAGVRNALARRLLLRAVERLRVGALRVELPDGATRRLEGRHPGPAATLRIHDDAFFPGVLLGGEIAFGEAYMDGLWSSPDLVALLELGARNREAFDLSRGGWRWASRLGDRRLHLGRRNTHDGARRNIAAHYDLGNDFFRLFLDETRTYSSAVFEHPEQDLADAQRHKYRLLAERLRLGPDDHVLEIGCGWGGFAIEAATTYGCRVTANTISREQLELARRRVADAGLADRVDLEFRDYRDIAGRYDALVSIEMLEAVGHEYLATFFERCNLALRPGGRMALQTIALPDRTYEASRDGVNWVQKYIFPGGALPSLAAIERALAGTALVIAGVDEIGLHYARTLREWRHRFLERRPEALAQGLDDRFLRMWEYYLAISEAGFRARLTFDYQIVFERPA
jgi:cyclopropane-fatty-acyl-phospholipid synthase